MTSDMTRTVKGVSLGPQRLVEGNTCLTVTVGNNLGSIFTLQNEHITIGRNPDAEIFIDDTMASWSHCYIKQEEHAFCIIDNSSTNGVYVNGVKTDAEELQIGDNLQIGETILKLESLTEQDIETRQSLYKRANYDLLTGVYNRHYFMEAATNELALNKREQTPFKLILIDLDFFKHVNDTYGHLAGDYVLRECATIIQGSKREFDTLGRYGGEEFILMLRGQLSLHELEEICERIRKKIEETTFEFGGESIKLTISLGICYKTRLTHNTLEMVIDLADKALYHSKENGRNTMSVYTDQKN